MLVLTLIANPHKRGLTHELAETVRSLCEAPSIDWLCEGVACDISLPCAVDPSHILQSIGEAPVDCCIQENDRRRKRVLIADMDSTMIDQECIDELAAEVGLKERVATITARAMNGEINFEDAVKERVSLLEGLSADITQSIIDSRITLASGGRTLVKTMKDAGNYTALVSGGFTSFTEIIAEMLGFDENRANRLDVNGGKLTGKVYEPILGADAKVEALHDIAARKGLQPSDFIAVGDGANDLPMLQIAGTGVALHAKPTVSQRARIRIDHGDLTALLYLQGYRQSDFIHG